MKSLRKKKNSVSDKTRIRIIRASEKIFAQGGYRAMTLREVTHEAGVNLAAVNYHFGSKSNLMHEMIRERFEPINQERLQQLEQAIEKYGHVPIPLEEVFNALFRPLLAGVSSTPVADTILIKILSRALTETTDFVRKMHKEFFVELPMCFIQQIKRTCPTLSEEDLQYRLFLSVSTMLGTIIEQVRLEGISGGKLDGSNLDRILNELTAYVVAGFKQK